jgi:serralysin
MSFHLYRINELYSNADGSIQFIELKVGDFAGESFWQGQSISDTQGGTTHTFTFPTNLPSTATNNTSVLIATQGFANLGIATPDFIVPSGFLFTNGGTLDYANVDAITDGLLPTDGTHSNDRNGASQTNSPTDFAGQTGTVTGSSGSGTTIIGGAGNDTLASGHGNDTIDGGAGIDTVVYTGSRSLYTITTNPNGSLTVADSRGASGDGTDILTNVERLKFTDDNVAFDISGDAGQAYRIYQAAFNRKPDLAGLGFWIGQMDNGLNVVDVAARFIDSPEYRSLYGTNPSTSAFVDAVYNNVLHRVTDQAGHDFYVNQIDTGQKSIAKVLADFSESPENQAQVIGVIQNGIHYVPWTG